MAAVARASHNFQTFKTEPILGIKSVEETGKIVGYASVFNYLDLHNDITYPGAFEYLDPDRITLLWSHIAREPIGKILDAKEDKKGLYFEAQLCLDVQRAREVYEMMKEGVFNGVSIGWAPLRYYIDPETGITHVATGYVFEISLAVNPANEKARVTQVKHESGGINNDPDLFGAIDRALRILAS
ncbi:primosomal replication protein N [Rickettsiales bacterium]|nr:primosomal replication protein N [Rickettsiales bacterium]